MFKALADPIRLRLLSMITSAGDEMCVCDLTRLFELSGPTISHHLKVLREAGLVDRRAARDMGVLPVRPNALQGSRLFSLFWRLCRLADSWLRRRRCRPRRLDSRRCLSEY